jgi:CDP-diacylglycerol--serine O-phosphatidyltransferase
MAPTMACTGFLMVSSLPTFSLKKISLSQKHFIPLSMGLVGLSASLISFPWLTLSIIMIVYVSTLPFSYWKYKKLEEFHTQPSLLTHVPS